MKVSVVIPAAGQGKRMKTKKNKQFLTLREKPILAHTINSFQVVNEVDDIIIVTRREEINYCRKEIVDKYNLNKVDAVVSGGSTRQDSIYNGLKALKEKTDFVLTHDGVRPLLTKKIIIDIISEVQKHKAVITAVPVKDTIKVVDNQKNVTDTLDRSSLMAVQTPQAFEKDMLLKAYRKAKAEGVVGTDSASLVERLNDESVKVINGDYENLKITTPEDLEFAEKIIRRRRL